MKKEDIMDGIGEIDASIVAETGEKRGSGRKRTRRKVLFSLIAAVLVLAIAGAAFGVMQFSGSKAKNAIEDAASMPTEEYDLEVTAKRYELSKDGSKFLVKSDSVGGREGVYYGEEDAAPADAKLEEGYPADDGDGAEVVSPAPPEEGGETGTPVDPDPYGAKAFVLTAAEWRDLDNWPFFTNLVNGERIAFPSFGLDPCRRIFVTVTDEEGSPLAGEKVTLLDGEGEELFAAVTDKDGKAYLFWGADDAPATVASGDASAEVKIKADTSGVQSKQLTAAADDAVLVKAAEAPARRALQVAFIIDTTGSMSDELAYLQKDFSSIAEDVGTDNVTYSVNFYRDEGDDYVTKCNPFSGDIEAVKGLLNGEICTGGGDTPEAVADILKAVITDNEDWADDCEKIAFLIFDAPPHEGTEDAIVEAVESAASRGIRLIPVVSSGSERDTELFGRAAAILTGGTYVFLTDDSGVGGSHLEPIVGDYKVELLHDVIVRIINEYKVG